MYWSQTEREIWSPNCMSNDVGHPFMASSWPVPTPCRAKTTRRDPILHWVYTRCEKKCTVCCVPRVVSSKSVCSDIYKRTLRVLHPGVSCLFFFWMPMGRALSRAHRLVLPSRAGAPRFTAPLYSVLQHFTAFHSAALQAFYTSAPLQKTPHHTGARWGAPEFALCW